jgi:hypothetical protein
MGRQSATASKIASKTEAEKRSAALLAGYSVPTQWLLINEGTPD